MRARLRFAGWRLGKTDRMARGDVQVVAGDDGWRVEIAADGGARSVQRTQAEAREAAREIARRNKRELFVHGREVGSASAIPTAETRDVGEADRKHVDT